MIIPCNAVPSQGFLSINLQKTNCHLSLVSQLSTSYALYYVLETTIKSNKNYQRISYVTLPIIYSSIANSLFFLEMSFFLIIPKSTLAVATALIITGSVNSFKG